MRKAGNEGGVENFGHVGSVGLTDGAVSGDSSG